MRRVADPPGTPVRGFRFGRVAAFKSEPWPASFRNGGRHQIGMPGRNASEFALKVGMVGKVKFETRIKELLENLPDLAELVEPLLIVRRTKRTDRHPAPPFASHRPG